MSKKQRSTGPVSKEGKAISSQNAITKGIFTKGYLPWEDPQEQEQLVHALVKGWDANQHPERMTFIRDIEEADLRLARARQAERLQIEGVMQSHDIAREFVNSAGLAITLYNVLPHWFFRTDEVGQYEKRRALYLDRVQEQALECKLLFNDQMIGQIQERFPDLHHYVMQQERPNTSFIAAISVRYKQSVPTLNLGVLSNEIGEKWAMHLQWALDPERYEIIIAGIRAKVVMEILGDERTTRYLVSAQNRKLKASQGLAAMTQLQWQKAERQRTIAYSSGVLGADASPLAQVSRANSVADLVVVQSALANTTLSHGAGNGAGYTISG